MVTQAENIIRICGGARKVAALAGRSYGRVLRWTYPKDRGGTGGLIPAEVQQDLLRAARAEGISLLPKHFFTGISFEEANCVRSCPITHANNFSARRERT